MNFWISRVPLLYLFVVGVQISDGKVLQYHVKNVRSEDAEVKCGGGGINHLNSPKLKPQGMWNFPLDPDAHHIHDFVCSFISGVFLRGVHIYHGPSSLAYQRGGLSYEIRNDGIFCKEEDLIYPWSDGLDGNPVKPQRRNN